MFQCLDCINKCHGCATLQCLLLRTILITFLDENSRSDSSSDSEVQHLLKTAGRFHSLYVYCQHSLIKP